MIQPGDAAASAGRPWIYASVASGLLAFLALYGALRVAGDSSSSPGGSVRGADLRRAHKSLQIAERALEQSKAEEDRLRGEFERASGELRSSQEALATRDASIGEAEAKTRAAEEHSARIETELKGARSELAA